MTRSHKRASERYAAATRAVELYAAELARARERVRADPGSPAALVQLEAAEQLDYLARYELRHARRALRRREAFDVLVARWLPTPSPRR